MCANIKIAPPQIGYRVPRNLEKIALKETQNNEIELQKSKDRKAHYAIGWLL